MPIENKRIAVYLPNLAVCGGGAEVYGLLLAEMLDEYNSVVILTCEQHDKSIDIESVYDMYGVKHFDTVFLSYRNVKHTIGYQIWKEMDKLSKSVDIFINCTYGIMRGMRDTLSIHIIHFPFPRLTGMIGKLYNRIYVNSYHGYICNSKYTQGYLEEYWNVKSTILYPPIAMKVVDDSVLQSKEKVILAVGRIVNDKKILDMIEAFKRICDKGISDYKFVLIGNKDEQELDYLNRVIEAVKDYPIEIHTNIKKQELVRWYRKASIFWHAKGLNEEEDPYNSEHFGMTTVEAMANGCLPIVINKAGQKEIVEHRVDGYRWDTIDELIEYTILVISDKQSTYRMQKQAVNESCRYLMDQFKENANRILDGIVRDYGQSNS